LGFLDDVPEQGWEFEIGLEQESGLEHPTELDRILDGSKGHEILHERTSKVAAVSLGPRLLRLLRPGSPRPGRLVVASANWTRVRAVQ
jgi:hypothetical protein